jgi:hypothetical protein
MAQRRIVVGTDPVLIAENSPKRTYISIILLPTNIEAGNTGNVFIGKGFAPVNTIGSPMQGDIIQSAGGISDSAKYKGDTSVFKGQYWAVASVAGQVLMVDEASDVDTPSPVTSA